MVHLNGKEITSAMMKIIMKDATLMEATVADLMSTLHIAKCVSV